MLKCKSYFRSGILWHWGADLGWMLYQGTLPIPQLGMKKAGILKKWHRCSAKIEIETVSKYMFLQLIGNDMANSTGVKSIIFTYTCQAFMKMAQMQVDLSFMNWHFLLWWLMQGPLGKMEVAPRNQGNQNHPEEIHKNRMRYCPLILTASAPLALATHGRHKSHHIAREGNMYMRRPLRFTFHRNYSYFQWILLNLAIWWTKSN